VERQFATGLPGFGGDPEFLTLLDSLPAGEGQAIMGSLTNLTPDPSVERWTGWYTPKAAGRHTIFVQNTGSYRLLIDDELVVDSTRIPAALLRQTHRTFGVGPHKIVFEQAAPQVFGRPFWRVAVVRDGTFVEPLAKQLASRADAVVLAVGFDSETETESADREFELPPGQEELIREIAAVNPNTVVVVIAGGSIAAAQWVDRTRALVAAWYPGQEGGSALADLLFGDANFSGRLPISWERKVEDNPSVANYYYNDPKNPNRIVYREGVFVGYRGYQRGSTAPLFPFGFGLSYTSFKYDKLSVTPTAANQGTRPALYEVSFDVTNTGARAGSDVTQIYVSPKNPQIERPRRELKGFERVTLAPGETRRVTIPLDARAFTYFDVKAGTWRADAGTYAVELARSSEDIVATWPLRLSRPLQLGVSD
jgi:beta-glucosidase